jgi:hypothetical protein
MLDIAARTPATGRIAYQFDLLALIEAKGPLAVTQRAQAFAACTCVIAIADNDADFSQRSALL